MRRQTYYIKYLTDDEFKKIKAFFEKLKSPSMKTCLKVMMYLGIRTSEAIQLKRENFNKDFSVLRFQVKKKKYPEIKERAVPEILRRELAAYYKAWHHRTKQGYLFFPTFRNQSKNLHLQGSTIRDKFKVMRRELGLNEVYYTQINGNKLHRISPHTLRHYALWKIYLAAGNCIISARDIIGHVKTETTARYIRSVHNRNKEREIIEKAFSA